MGLFGDIFDVVTAPFTAPAKIFVKVVDAVVPDVISKPFKKAVDTVVNVAKKAATAVAKTAVQVVTDPIGTVGMMGKATVGLGKGLVNLTGTVLKATGKAALGAVGVVGKTMMGDLEGAASDIGDAAKDVADSVSKDGSVTNFFQDYVPGGGLLTAGVHAAAGNTEHAELAAVKGVGTATAAVVAAAGAAMGPAGLVMMAGAGAAADTLVQGSMRDLVDPTLQHQLAQATPEGLIGSFTTGALLKKGLEKLKHTKVGGKAQELLNKGKAKLGSKPSIGPKTRVDSFSSELGVGLSKPKSIKIPGTQRTLKLRLPKVTGGKMVTTPLAGLGREAIPDAVLELDPTGHAEESVKKSSTWGPEGPEQAKVEQKPAKTGGSSTVKKVAAAALVGGGLVAAWSGGWLPSLSWLPDPGPGYDPNTPAVVAPNPLNGVPELKVIPGLTKSAVSLVAKPVAKPVAPLETEIAAAAPEPVETLTAAVAPVPDETLTAAVAPVPVETLTAAVDPVPDETLTAAVAPVPAETLTAAVDPVPDETLTAAVAPVPVESLTAAVDPVPDESLTAAVAPVPVETLTAAVDPVPDESLTAAVAPVPVETLTAAVAPVPVETLTAAVAPVPVETLTAAVEPVPTPPIEVLPPPPNLPVDVRLSLWDDAAPQQDGEYKLPIGEDDAASLTQQLQVAPELRLAGTLTDGTALPADYLMDAADNVVFDDVVGDPDDLIRVVYEDVDPGDLEGGRYARALTATGKGVGQAELSVSLLDAPGVTASLRVEVVSAGMSVDEYQFEEGLKSGDPTEAYVAAGRLVEKATANGDAPGLNNIAWKILDPEVAVVRRDLDLAQQVVDKAFEFSASRNMHSKLLHTEARILAHKGELTEALKQEAEAIQLGAGEPDLLAARDEYARRVVDMYVADPINSGLLGELTGLKDTYSNERDVNNLDRLAWDIVKPRTGATLTDDGAYLALQASKKAVELTQSKEPRFLVTEATAAYRLGDYTGALNSQTLAVTLAPQDASLKLALEKYRALAQGRNPSSSAGGKGLASGAPGWLSVSVYGGDAPNLAIKVWRLPWSGEGSPPLRTVNVQNEDAYDSVPVVKIDLPPGDYRVIAGDSSGGTAWNEVKVFSGDTVDVNLTIDYR